MGQNSSRVYDHETPSRRNPNSESDNNRESGSSSPSSTRRRPSTKRRSTVRRSIVNLVKPASRNNDSTGESGNVGGKRKSWLKSRRWSKAPAGQVAEPDLGGTVAGQPELVAGGVTNPTVLPAITPKETDAAAAAAAAAATSLTIPIPASLEAQQQQQDASLSNSNLTHEPPQDSDSIAPDTGDPSSISQNREVLEPSSSSNILCQPETTHIRPELESIESASSPTANIESSQNNGHEDLSILASSDDSEPAREITRTEEENISPVQGFANEPESFQSTQQSPSSLDVPHAATPIPNSTTHSNPNSPPQNRPFPPPGTLVVVQGVVHTTDVPRPVSTSLSSSPLSSSSPSNPEYQDQTQTPTQAGSRLSDSGLGSRIRRSVSNASRPRSEIGSSARNRLSALFSGSRPGSMVGRPSSSRSSIPLEEASSSTEIDVSSSSPDASSFRPVFGASSDSDPSVDVNSSSASSSGIGSAGRVDNESDATTVASQPLEGVSGSNEEQNQTSLRPGDRIQPTSPQPGMISSSSIDVLGTLLSVAAAATAASLLTGSSDPILPPTMASPDVARAGSLPDPSLGADPFAGSLGDVGGIGGLSTGNAGVGANGRADRMRQAWGSIRERLGLRPNSTSSAGLGNDLAADPVGGVAAGNRDENVPLLSDIDGRRSESENRSEQPRAARDRMLAEMARAFQLGLGLTGPPIEGEHTTGAGVEPRAEGGLPGADPVGFGIGRTRIGELPPEGSFERFLVDLQTDLRTALGGGAQQQRTRPQEQEQEPEDDEQEVARRPGDRENDIDELFRLIAEAEAEVRQRQRIIAERQAALRALMSGATAALESVATNAQSPPTTSSALPSALNRRARVESVPDSDEETSASLPMVEDLSDDSDSEDEAPVRNSVANASQSPNPEAERTEAGPSRLSSVFDRHPSSARGVNSISEALNRRRAMGIGRTPPTSSALRDTGPPFLSPVTEVPLATRGAALHAAPPLESAVSSSTSDSTSAPSSPTQVEAEELPVSSTVLSASANPDGDAPESTTETVPTTLSPASEPSNNTPRSQTGSRNAIDDGTGRINWWRLYRFPPIAAPPPRTTGQWLGQTREANAATPVQAPTSSNPLPSPLQDSPSLQPDVVAAIDPSTSSPEVGPTSPPQQPSSQGQNEALPQQAAANTVVPVIVVGLQSVNLAFFGPGARGQQPNGTPAPTTAAATPSPAVPSENEEDVPSVSGSEQDDPTRENRQRRWQSRAAEAFRTLRHGRNTPQRPPGELLPDMLDGPGSRTFLIYVIGGYYPPDHNIVTGDPDTLDSFEALLDLADLLGQVRPPTASKEDIERSGLEVIKAPQVPQYEQEGKISSNCTERCLICLDDYEAEDDVRVLTCKHAFHMNCVDKWLQEGKNNCPACRGAGVVTSS
ncbi:hypothetical protein L218DRAFT_1075924 [Marasmius fiardii PR-910]|nr:hypothetical protein L218DRAFT_1075924 [Marasmius fiardii PR-910]